MTITPDRELFLLTLLLPPLTYPRIQELSAADQQLIEIVTRRFRLHEPKAEIVPGAEWPGHLGEE